MVEAFVVNLDVPEKDRWKHIIPQYSEKILMLVRKLEAEVASVGLGGLKSAAEFLVKAFDSCGGFVLYRDELLYLSEALRMPFEEVLLVQIYYELCACCTSLLADDDQGAIHFRTMDWPLPELNPLTITVDFHKGGQLLYRTVTWAGFVGVLTGVRVGCYSISVNFRSLGGNPLGNLMRSLTGCWPVGYLVRDVLESQSSYAAACQTLENARLVSPSYIIVKAAVRGVGRVITRDPSGFSSRSFRDAEENKEFLVQTNVDWGVAVAPDGDILYSTARIEAVEKLFAQFKQNEKRSSPPDDRERNTMASGPTADDIVNGLFRHPVLNEDTVYMVVMDPAARDPQKSFRFMFVRD
eukprot:Rmarinus@m.4334